MNRKGSAALLVTVFAVNFLSLVYQVIWTRNIMAIFGSTALSVSTTLTVFLSGIALGGYLGGKWIGAGGLAKTRSTTPSRTPV